LFDESVFFVAISILDVSQFLRCYDFWACITKCWL